jgi:hypothetical protein
MTAPANPARRINLERHLTVVTSNERARGRAVVPRSRADVPSSPDCPSRWASRPGEVPVRSGPVRPIFVPHRGAVVYRGRCNARCHGVTNVRRRTPNRGKAKCLERAELIVGKAPSAVILAVQNSENAPSGSILLLNCLKTPEGSCDGFKTYGKRLKMVRSLLVPVARRTPFVPIGRRLSDRAHRLGIGGRVRVFFFLGSRRRKGAADRPFRG